MTSLNDPLTLPCGQVLPNRIMKAALSEGLANKQHAPDGRLEQLYTTWSHGGYGLLITGNVMVDHTQLGEPGNVVIEMSETWTLCRGGRRPPRTPDSSGAANHRAPIQSARTRTHAGCPQRDPAEPRCSDAA